jgi:hypothetical protein
VPSGSPGAGVESITHTWPSAGTGPSASSDSATLPPKEWPTTAAAGAGHPSGAAISARTSAAQAATVCGGVKAGDAPCRRRSTSAAAHSGRPAISPRAIAAQLRPLP